MKTCTFCGKEFEKSGYSSHCSASCYQKEYYQKNREKRVEYGRKRHKETYIPHPIKKKTEEEKKATRKQYYLDHKEEMKKRNNEYYRQHKNDPKYRKMHNEAVKRYYRRNKLKKEE